MPEEEKKVETTETQVQAPEPPQGETPEVLKAELEKAREALKAVNREAAERRKKLEAYEAEEAKRKEAEMTETQKLQKQLESTQAELQAVKTNEIRRRVGAKYNLPEPLALRLQGANEEEMEADAKTLAEALPKPQPKQPGPQPANPGANGRQGLTDAEKRARAYGQGVDIFDANSANERGGGVIFTDREL